MTSSKLFKKIFKWLLASNLLVILMLIMVILFIITGITTNDSGRIVTTLTGDYTQTTASIFDSNKASGASSLSTNGWSEEWVNQFYMNASDPPYIDGEYIDNFLKNYYSDSPLIGYGETIKQFADYYGVSVGAFIGQIAKETTFGRASCGGDYNFGCIMWTADQGLPKKYAVDREWIDPPTIEAGIESYFHLVRTNYIDKGFVQYDAYLERYSPTFENNQATFKNIMWGALKAFGYDTSDTNTKQKYAPADEQIDGKMDGSTVVTSNNTSSSSSSTLSIDLSNTRLSTLTLSWKSAIEKEMNQQGLDQKYLPILLGILQNESGGGGVVDIFQASESKGWSMNDPRMTSELMSIQVAVEHFKRVADKAERYGKSIWAVVAGYNFGDAFLDYLNRTNQDWTIEVAKEYSATVVAPSLGNTNRQQAPFVNDVSMSYGIPYYYWNGGNFHYVPMLMYALGYDLDEIKAIALNGGNELKSMAFMNDSEINNEEFSLAGDSFINEIKNVFSDRFISGYVYYLDYNDLKTLRGLEDNIILSIGNDTEIDSEYLRQILNYVTYKNIYITVPFKGILETEDEDGNIIEVDLSDSYRQQINKIAFEYDNVKVFDWSSYAKPNRSNYFDNENRMTESGKKAYVNYLFNSISRLKPKLKSPQYLFNKFQEGVEQTSNLGSNLVEIAKTQLGMPYSWGGGGKEGATTGIYDPSVQDATNIVGFDCSGFMQFVYYQAYGIDIGDWTVPQEKSGTRINIDELEVGDLLFWGSSGATIHVAMYIGDNQLIESSMPGHPISIRPMRSFDFAIRVDVERLKQEQGIK